jgi:small subunit ribosomal protein S8
MAIADPIADMLTRIRNAIQVKKQTVVIPGSNLKREILNRLNEAGYVSEVSWEDDGRQGILTVELKYDDNEESVIDGLDRASTQGRRVYVGVDDIPVVRSGYGTVILSTSKGVLTDTQARKLGVGGEVLCTVW